MPEPELLQAFDFAFDVSPQKARHHIPVSNNISQRPKTSSEDRPVGKRKPNLSLSTVGRPASSHNSSDRLSVQHYDVISASSIGLALGSPRHMTESIALVTDVPPSLRRNNTVAIENMTMNRAQKTRKWKKLGLLFRTKSTVTLKSPSYLIDLPTEVGNEESMATKPSLGMLDVSIPATPLSRYSAIFQHTRQHSPIKMARQTFEHLNLPVSEDPKHVNDGVQFSQLVRRATSPTVISSAPDSSQRSSSSTQATNTTSDVSADRARASNMPGEFVRDNRSRRQSHSILEQQTQHKTSNSSSSEPRLYLGQLPVNAETSPEFPLCPKSTKTRYQDAKPSSPITQKPRSLQSTHRLVTTNRPGPHQPHLLSPIIEKSGYSPSIVFSVPPTPPEKDFRFVPLSKFASINSVSLKTANELPSASHDSQAYMPSATKIHKRAQVSVSSIETLPITPIAEISVARTMSLVRKPSTRVMMQKSVYGGKSFTIIAKDELGNDLQRNSIERRSHFRDAESMHRVGSSISLLVEMCR